MPTMISEMPVTNSPDGRNVSNVTMLKYVNKGAIQFVSGMNVLGLVVFSIAFGITMSRLGEAGKPIQDFFLSLNEVVMRLVGLVMW